MTGTFIFPNGTVWRTRQTFRQFIHLTKLRHTYTLTVEERRVASELRRAEYNNEYQKARGRNVRSVKQNQSRYFRKDRIKL